MRKRTRRSCATIKSWIISPLSPTPMQMLSAKPRTNQRKRRLGSREGRFAAYNNLFVHHSNRQFPFVVARGLHNGRRLISPLGGSRLEFRVGTTAVRTGLLWVA